MNFRQLLTAIAASWLLNNTVAAQATCTGTLGDPIINITFGTLTNPQIPAPASTNYTYILPIYGPSDGEYTVVNRIDESLNGGWYGTAHDHTGNPNGCFMLVNASYDPSDFYTQSISGLCPNTVYQFSAYVYNILKFGSCDGAEDEAGDPDLIFSIETTDGIVLQKYQTTFPRKGANVWVQASMLFSSASNTDVILRITNAGKGGCGNDLALDDITFRPCGPAISATINNGASADLCMNTPLPLSGTVFGTNGNEEYQWQISADNGTTWNDIPGATSITPPNLKVTTLGIFTYRLLIAQRGNIQSPKCRVASNTIKLTVNPYPVVTATNDGPACDGTSITLHSDGAAAYSWTGPNNFMSIHADTTIAASPGMSGTYKVVAYSDKNCMGTASTIVKINGNPTADAGADVTVCQNRGTGLIATGGASYSWAPAAGLSASNIANPTADPQETTNYIVQVTDNNGCSDNDTVTVNILKNPVANAGPDKETSEGNPVRLDGHIDGGDHTYSWSPSTDMADASSLTPAVKPSNDITYTLTVVSKEGCGTATDEVFVKVYKAITVPNAFSPNGDGQHDTWLIAGLNTYPASTTEVFNRYGQLVFHSAGYDSPWDGRINGKPLPVGTYYYVINVKKGNPPLAGSLFIVK